MILLQLFMMVICTATGNVFLKFASLHMPSHATIIARIFHPLTIFGLLFFGLGVTFYITLLGNLSLSRAQSFASAQFIGTVIASYFIFQDAISIGQWIGMCLIALGIVLVGFK